VAELERQLSEDASLRERASSLAHRVRDAEALAERAAELQKKLAETGALLQKEKELVAELEARVAEGADRERRIADLEAALARKSLAPPPAVDTADLGWEAHAGGDDLRRIRGIGPGYERSLNGLGVRSYAQLAGSSAEDVARIARTLKVKRDRVEQWVQRASELVTAKPG
jgi:predicted flap endonuclease-1-like 5' DNA nuclease